MCNIIYRQVTKVFLPREMQLSCQMSPLSSEFFYVLVCTVVLIVFYYYCGDSINVILSQRYRFLDDIFASTTRLQGESSSHVLEM